MKARRRRSSAPALPTFFLDRNIGGMDLARKIAGEFGWRVEIHDSHFAKDAADEDWLPQVSRKNWVVLTKDKKIRYRRLEREALENSGGRAFIFTKGDLSSNDLIAVLQKARFRIEKRIWHYERPFIFKISPKGAVSELPGFSYRKIPARRRR